MTWFHKLFHQAPSSANSNLPSGNATTSQAAPQPQGTAAQAAFHAISSAENAIREYREALQVPRTANVESQVPGAPRIRYHDMNLLCEKFRNRLEELEVTEDEIDPQPEDDQIEGMLAVREQLERSFNKAESKLDELEGEFPPGQREESALQVDDKVLEKMLMQVETFMLRLAQTAILHDEYRTRVLKRRGVKAKERKAKIEEKAAKHKQNMETLLGASTAVTNTFTALAAAARST
jgi:hypothetical protein